MCDVITREQWMRFASPDCPDALKAKILLHAASCPECRSFAENIRTVRHLLHTEDRRTSVNTFSGSAYQAVASAGGAPSPSGTRSGFLSVEFGRVGNRLCFDPDSLLDEGCAGKYALNANGEATVLEDDRGALVLALEGQELVISLEDGVRASVRILLDDREPLCAEAGPSLRLTLPDAPMYTLEITFA